MWPGLCRRWRYRRGARLRPLRRFEQAPCSLDVYLAGFAKGARRTVDYGIDALYGRLQPLSCEKVPSYGAGSAAPAKDTRPDALGAETLFHTPAEHPCPSRDEDLRRVHLEFSLSACSSGGTLPSFSGLTTRPMVLMLPSATSRVTTLWGLLSPK